jgi:hypothetical protein
MDSVKPDNPAARPDPAHGAPAVDPNLGHIIPPPPQLGRRIRSHRTPVPKVRASRVRERGSTSKAADETRSNGRPCERSSVGWHAVDALSSVGCRQERGR